MDISTQVEFIRKKEFKERCSIHVYGKGERRRVALYYDWKEDIDNNIHGYKYMIKGYGCTKSTILNDGYDFFINNNYSELCWYDVKEAKTNQDRFKVSIIG